MAANVEAAADGFDALSLEYNPSNRLGFYKRRVELFEKFREREQQRVEEARKAGVVIKVVLPDGAVKEAIKGATTPLDVANEISKSLAKRVLVAKVDGAAWDAFRPLEGDCALQLLTWDDPDGKEVRAPPIAGAAAGRRASRARAAPLALARRAGARGACGPAPACDGGPDEGALGWPGGCMEEPTGLAGTKNTPQPALAPLAPPLAQTFWHSSAHVLGEALEMEFGVDLTIGPALEEGFYYDCYMGDKARPFWGGGCRVQGVGCGARAVGGAWARAPASVAAGRGGRAKGVVGG
jgi:hypothetical protein